MGAVMDLKAVFQKEIIDKKRLPIIISVVWLIFWFSTSFRQYYPFDQVRFFSYGLFPVLCYYAYMAVKNSKSNF